MLEEPPGRYRAILDDHAGRQCLGIEMPLPVTGLRFGMGLDDQSRVRVILPRPSQHLGEAVGIRLPQPDRGVSRASGRRSARSPDRAGRATDRRRCTCPECASAMRAMISRCAVEKGPCCQGGWCASRVSRFRRPRGVENGMPLRSMTSPDGGSPDRPGWSERQKGILHPNQRGSGRLRGRLPHGARGGNGPRPERRHRPRACRASGHGRPATGCAGPAAASGSLR